MLRAPDLRALQHGVVSVLPRGWRARSTALVVPTRSAAEQLRRTIENAVLPSAAGHAVLLPDLVTRHELYARLHACLPEAPPLLTEFEREVLLRLAAEAAERTGAGPPFRLRPGLLAAILAFYDELQRRLRSIDTFDRLVRGRLEPGSDSDRGAARLLDQTLFLSTMFAAFERRVADTGRIDEHGLRSLLLASEVPTRYAHIIACVADEAADPRGLWPADFDLLARLPGLERLDVLATERMLGAGLHQRLHDVLPGLAEERLPASTRAPVLLAPRSGAADEPFLHFVCRDREEELADNARWIKHRARAAGGRASHMALDRTAIVFQRPLPYLYLAREVFGSSSIPYQALDSLPLAAEPFAAAVDLVFTVLTEEASRSSLVELLGSQQWTFADPAEPSRPLQRHEIAAFDCALRELKYLGGWDTWQEVTGPAGRSGEPGAPREPNRAGSSLPRRVAGAVAALAAELEPVSRGPSMSAQLDALLAFVARHERLPSGECEPDKERHLRARGAVLGALATLRAAHLNYDNRPMPMDELVATIRRWMEAQTFAPRTGRGGALLLDAPAAAFAGLDRVHLVGIVESDWPERSGGNIFYPSAVLRDLGWPPETDRLAAARARFIDLLWVAGSEVSVSSFSLEEDALVAPSPFLEDLGAAGLSVERIDGAPPTRIFAHEALSLGPVAEDAVSKTARQWLAMRRGRTIASDPRFRGVVGARPAEPYAVSRVERYLACPFKYFAGHVLQLEEERDDESGLTPQERGQLLHGIFEAFFNVWCDRGGTTITIATLDQAVALFAEVAESRLQALPEADRALERTYLLGSAASPGLAERAFAFEIEHGISVVERLLEHPFDGLFAFEGPDGVRSLRVRGKADRIDLLADGTMRIVDYKLGRAPKPSRVLQLPIYGVCAEQALRGYRGQTWTLSRAGYVAFRERNPFVELGGRSGSLHEALREGQHRFVQAIEQIEAGVFPANPDEPWTCTRCGFPQVCRKDYVGDE